MDVMLVHRKQLAKNGFIDLQELLNKNTHLKRPRNDATALNVIDRSVSKRLHAMGKVHKKGKWMQNY